MSCLIIPRNILTASEITVTARLVLAQLYDHRNKRTGQCNPKIRTLASELGLSISTVGRALRSLREAAMVKITWRQRSSDYQILNGQNDRTENPDRSKRPIKNGQNDRSDDPVSLYEPNFIEPNTSNAAVPLRVPIPRCAAAAASSFAFAQQKSQPDPIRVQAEELVEELHAVHPQPGLPDKAVAEAEQILRASSDPDETVETVRRNHAAWKAHWEMLRPGQFIPQLWRWLRDGEWRRSVSKPVRQENWYQRQDRKQEESDKAWQAHMALLKTVYTEEDFRRGYA